MHRGYYVMPNFAVIRLRCGSSPDVWLFETECEAEEHFDRARQSADDDTIVRTVFLATIRATHRRGKAEADDNGGAR
jgi:hypothetical protein